MDVEGGVVDWVFDLIHYFAGGWVVTGVGCRPGMASCEPISRGDDPTWQLLSAIQFIVIQEQILQILCT